MDPTALLEGLTVGVEDAHAGQSEGLDSHGVLVASLALGGSGFDLILLHVLVQAHEVFLTGLVAVIAEAGYLKSKERDQFVCDQLRQPTKVAAADKRIRHCDKL